MNSGSMGTSSSSIGHVRTKILACAASLLIVPAVLAVPTDKYTSKSKCNADNTKWTITSTCTKTVGGSAYALDCGVQYSPATAGPPTVTITDEQGIPITVGPVILTMEASTVASDRALSRYGTYSSAYVWSGFESNVLITAPVAAGSTVYMVTYAWPVSVQARGAAWFSDDGDVRNGSIVVDSLAQVGCGADFNGSGTVTVQDIFDFLTAWFAHSPSADFNQSGAISVQDIFDFLTAWFAGCH